MKEKKLWLVITFHTTAAAIAMEKLCRAKGLPGRLIPVPRELTADCGMSWRAEVQDRAALAARVDDVLLDHDVFERLGHVGAVGRDVDRGEYLTHLVGVDIFLLAVAPRERREGPARRRPRRRAR